ncbi:MAG: ABC transporter permease [Mesorhizobium sp. 65-26]|nr:MAG: ABC transporter permease [Mesorhizobium sp. 65-26]
MPTKIFSELMSKPWMEPIIPFTALVALVLYFGAVVPNYFSFANISTLLRQFAELGFVALAVGLTLISGGVDLSVGSIFALVDLTVLVCLNIYQLPLWLSIAAGIAVGAALGGVNGFFIGFMKTRPFLTTLVTLIIYRALFNMLSLHYSADLSSAFVFNETWDWAGSGFLFGMPVNAVLLLVTGLVGHVLLSRSKFGWRVVAVGASRKAARHAGISYSWVLFYTYIVAGAIAAVGAIFYASRLNSIGSTTGVGLEITALAAVVTGGVSLSGGRGTVGSMMIGTGVVFLLVNNLTSLGVSAPFVASLLGFILLLAVGLDVKWAKNRHKAIEKTYVNPVVLELGPLPDTSPGTASPLSQNDVLRSAEALCIDRIEGPEDIVIDSRDWIYAGTRQGWIVRSAPPYDEVEIFARIGGRPLGLAMDAEENIYVCVAGMGLYMVAPDGTTSRLADRTNRSLFTLIDNSRLRLTDDLDIAPDGKVYFSEATYRFEMHEWMFDSLEGRASGRVCCYDPKTGKTTTVLGGLHFANGICVAHDGQSVFVAETWACRVKRLWIKGPKAGQAEILLDNLPGQPDNINRASDGTYWLALCAMRSPANDLSLKHPGFRLRMVKNLPKDEWLFQGSNHGCVLRFDENGQILESMWDAEGVSHPQVTSMREHKGYLYLGGLENNRIGRIPLPWADKSWTSLKSYWRRPEDKAAPTPQILAAE